MPLFAGVWYADWSKQPLPTASDAHRGLVLLPSTLDQLCRSAAGCPVTWEHSAVSTIQNADPGKEREAAINHSCTVGKVKASWIERSTGYARVVFEIFDTCPMVCALINSKALTSLSATHIVGGVEMVELSLTNTPARPGCNIDGGVSSITDYIAIHPPL
ncbi:MAG: hypothetical protein CL678_17480 [Bdellovibrionaceae bacterium]|nr:hypothetical protein [Pseudobdellovibrionaceae bacterium]|tara:strand:- start:726 stop:1205 length:480 start_codon:yes stop_codon:yes gene_type:complete